MIHAKAVFPGDPPPEGSALYGEVRMALLEVITREGWRGRDLGYDRVRVFLNEGRGVVAEMDPDGVIARYLAE